MTSIAVIPSSVDFVGSPLSSAFLLSVFLSLRTSLSVFFSVDLRLVVRSLSALRRLVDLSALPECGDDLELDLLFLDPRLLDLLAARLLLLSLSLLVVDVALRLCWFSLLVALFVPLCRLASKS